MKSDARVDVLSISNITSANGVNVFNRNLFNSKSLDGKYQPKRLICFERGVVTEFKKGNLPDISENKSKVDSSNNWLSHTTKKIVKKSSLLSFAAICKLYLYPAFKVVKKAKNSDGKFILAQDLFCAFFCKNFEKTIFVSHSSSSPLEQVYLYFPALKSGIGSLLLKSLLKKAVKNSHGVVTLGEEARQYYIKEFPLAKVEKIYNGIPDVNSKFKAPNLGKTKSLRFVLVGSVIFRKGYDLLIDAVSSLSKVEQANCEFFIYGDSSSSTIDELKIKIKEKDLENRIHFMGVSPNITSVLNQYDAFLQTSRDEGLPMAMIEASAIGLPILSTDVGSIKEVYELDSIMYMEPEITSICNTLSIFVNFNSKQHQNLGRKSRSVYENKLSHSKMWEKYSDFFEGL
ncbi:glycosyltransferase [Vibrio sp. B513a]|uniref:glycosyltransferase n=1 Tax=Vibrio sp. B513a TaxID=2836183 RepID=UPI0025567795|nr:glycosyltransferase [Vibrio sp. B513a]MDK9750025.1 glycosyltransferase [Vibrio sp. B513a]